MNIPGPLYVVVESVLEVAQTRLKYGGAQCEMVEKEVDGERERERTRLGPGRLSSFVLIPLQADGWFGRLSCLQPIASVRESTFGPV